MYIMRTKIEWYAAKNTYFPLKFQNIYQYGPPLHRVHTFFCKEKQISIAFLQSDCMQRMPKCMFRPSAWGNTHPTAMYQTASPQDYIIILLYLGCMTSSGQIENSKLYNSVSFGPNKNRFGQIDQTTKRSISTKGIRNRGKFEPSISVAQKWWCLGVSHHRI